MNVKNPSENNWDKEWKIYNKNPFFKPNKGVLKIINKCFKKKIKNKKILELGAGSGSDIVSLAKNQAKAYAIDFSKESIITTKYWANEKNVKVTAIKADIKKIPHKDKYFDLVYSVGLMEHFENNLKYIKEQIRVIKPKGFLIIDVPQKYTLYTIAKHIRMKLNTHPFGWETEFSKKDLINIAKYFKQDVYMIYGRDSDVIQKLPIILQPMCKAFFSKTIENTFIAPYICLNIGLILKIK